MIFFLAEEIVRLQLIESCRWTDVTKLYARYKVVYKIAETDTPDAYRAYISSEEEIISYIATSEPWTTWEHEPGFRLELDSSSGLESSNLRFPTVVKLVLSRSLMIYETTMSGCQRIQVGVYAW